MRTQANNQRHASAQWPVQIAAALTALDGVIATLNEQLATLEREIAQVLRDGAGAASATLLLTRPGIGRVTSAWLLVSTLNCTLAYTPEQRTADAGLVPLARPPGTRVRRRATIGPGGHSHVRTALSMATLRAARGNPPMRAFSQRVRGAGKPMNVARGATARTWVYVAWAWGKTNRPYRAPVPNPPAQRAG